MGYFRKIIYFFYQSFVVLYLFLAERNAYSWMIEDGGAEILDHNEDFKVAVATCLVVISSVAGIFLLYKEKGKLFRLISVLVLGVVFLSYFAFLFP